MWSGSRSGLVGSLVGFWEASGRVIVHGVRGSCHRRSRFTLYGGGFHGVHGSRWRVQGAWNVYEIRSGVGPGRC